MNEELKPPTEMNEQLRSIHSLSSLSSNLARIYTIGVPHSSSSLSGMTSSSFGLLVHDEFVSSCISLSFYVFGLLVDCQIWASMFNSFGSYIRQITIVIESMMGDVDHAIPLALVAIPSFSHFFSLSSFCYHIRHYSHHIIIAYLIYLIDAYLITKMPLLGQQK
ncbi:hypothetical protein BLOT_004095 [Blomia tropicalis]|nr:hypothetical protein BLOT_004095 [Blomia tropicalis]